MWELLPRAPLEDNLPQLLQSPALVGRAADDDDGEGDDEDKISKTAVLSRIIIISSIITTLNHLNIISFH